MNRASIIGKIVIQGDLILNSPLLIGDGAGETSDNFKDIHVIKNSEDKPFIPGTSLCGVLREYMRDTNFDMVQKIFGDADKMQSSIQIEDIKLENFKITSRDGVKIDGFTGTGIDGGKYDYEAIDRGAHGKLNLLLNLRACHVDDENFANEKYTLDEIFGTVKRLMKKLADGIRIGALTAKGFGAVSVKNISADVYDFRKKQGVEDWLTKKPSKKKLSPATEIFSSSPDDFIVDADFAFNSSFIVKNYDIGAADKNNNISAVSLKSRDDFVIPGTSLKGVFRHRAEYILSKFNLPEKSLDELMGTSDGDKKIKSRLIVSESYISPANVKELPHTQNKIDRFTGGTLQGTLFTSKPVYQKNFDAPTLHVHFEIRKAKDFHAGLAIFLLRDLWLGKVALGGEKSVGRGTVQGISAEINFKNNVYKIGKDGKIISGNSDELSRLAATVKSWGDDK